MRIFVMLALTAISSVAAEAQEQGAVTLYSKGHFAGPAVTVSRPTSNMTPLSVQSLRISPGTVWELCSGNTFTGCERFSKTQAAMVRTVRSVRPILAPIPQGASLPSDGLLSRPGLSLRGLASEFFVAPAEGGSRVDVATKEMGAELRAATQFCRSRGWRTSAYQRVQSVGDRTFLADVLCVDQDR